MKTILAAIDFSPVTTRVLAEAIALARGAHAHVVLLNVTTPHSLLRDYVALEALVCRREPKGRMGNTSQEMRTIHGYSLQVIGDPVEVILQQAARCSADYIVLGSHGHSALFEALVGGTAAGVIKGATCPVILIPSKQEAQNRRGRPVRRRHPVARLRRNEKPATRIGSSIREGRRPAWTAP